MRLRTWCASYMGAMGIEQRNASPQALIHVLFILKAMIARFTALSVKGFKGSLADKAKDLRTNIDVGVRSTPAQRKLGGGSIGLVLVGAPLTLLMEEKSSPVTL
ncbi:hypothetical protein Ancab_004901, partial [Ancistrocladus abbreviatus]